MEVDQAISIARSLSNRFYHTHNMIPHLEQEDYTQDCLVAWLRYKNMNFACIDTFRDHAPLSRKYAREGKPVPIHINREILDYDSYSEVEGNLDLYFIQRAMRKLPDRIYQVLDMYYFQHMSLLEIGLLMGFTESRALQIKAEGIKILKRKLNGNGCKTTISH